jgi:hypothetical protein
MNDVLARAACALEDDPLCRQDITKDIDNEIAIAQRYMDACWRGSFIIRTRSQSFGRRIADRANDVAVGE